MRLKQGRRLGPYEILEALGAGGMGEVYRARDTRLDRLVAIKVLTTQLSAHPDLRRRFDREARLISSLNHPHVCALFDVGHESGIDFLVMEHLEGTTLAQRISEGPLPLEAVVRVGREIAEALSAAHANGVVHRDLKPGNVMLTRSGVKLLDFGLAKIAQPVVTASASETTKETADPASPGGPITAEGAILGTFQYMAPEQIEGHEADPRSDIFALGAILYEMATGRRAFQGGSRASLIASILKDRPPPITSIEPMTPPALERIVHACLEKDPQARWQTAHDVALQLSWIAEGGSETGVPKPVARRRRSRERLAWITVAVLGLAVLGLGSRELLREPAPMPRTVRFQILPPDGLTSMGTPRISPDGRLLAFEATDSTGTTKVWIRPLEALSAHPLNGTEGAGRPFWSPDSRSLAFFAGPQLKRVDVGGGAVRVILDGVTGYDGTWSEQGTILFDVSKVDSIRSVPAAGGLAKAATTIDRAAGQTGHGWPLFLPDGKHFLFLARYQDADGDSLCLGELGSVEARTLGAAGSLVDYCEPGYVLWVDRGVLLARRLQAGSWRFQGEPFPVTTSLAVGATGLANFSTSRNGNLAYRPGGTYLKTLTWVDRAGRELTTVGPPGDYANPAVDPTGERIVVDLASDGGNEDLWLLEASRGTSTRLTFSPEREGSGTWSPDGSRIAFVAAGNEAWKLKTLDARGASEPSEIQAEFPGGPSDWSADGRTLLVNAYSGESRWDVWAVPLAGGESIPVAAGPFREVQGRFSPDGRWIAYASTESGRTEVYVRSWPGTAGKWQISTEGGTEPQWRQDGKELFYLSLRREIMAVDVDAGPGFQAGRPRRLFPADLPLQLVTRNRYVASPDGQRFLLLKQGMGGAGPITVVLNWAAEAGGN
ncbi:MAG: protein kinase [Candidatus Krumholzibacteriia bacterium]